MWSARRRSQTRRAKLDAWTGRPQASLRENAGDLTARGRLLAKNEVHAHAAHLNGIAVIQAHGAGNGTAVNLGDFVAWTDVVTVVALIDLRGHFGLEPSFQAD